MGGLEIKMCKARLYIIDEHITVRTALAERLDQAANLLVVGHAGDVEEVMQEVKEKKPDIVLLEVKRKDGMGLEILRSIVSMECSPRIAVLTSYPTKWEEDAALRAGAVCYMMKDLDSEELICMISRCAKK
ncbi:MAG: response regulator transcription factor [Anaerolineales bacterium]|nr:response regulator transcription factor [Anaerolineales bacterium]